VCGLLSRCLICRSACCRVFQARTLEASRHTLELDVLDSELGEGYEEESRGVAESPQHSLSSTTLMASLGHNFNIPRHEAVLNTSSPLLSSPTTPTPHPDAGRVPAGSSLSTDPTARPVCRNHRSRLVTVLILLARLPPPARHPQPARNSTALHRGVCRPGSVHGSSRRSMSAFLKAVTIFGLVYDFIWCDRHLDAL